MDGEAGWWTTSGNIGLPPLARAMGVGRQQHVGLLGWVGNKGVLEWGNVPEEVPMDTEKVTSKINEVDSKVEDRFLKHELQMQLMAENMEGIMQMIAHKLDSLEKKGLHHGDKKEEVSLRWKLPTFDGTSKWGPYAKQAGVIFE